MEIRQILGGVALGVGVSSMVSAFGTGPAYVAASLAIALGIASVGIGVAQAVMRSRRGGAESEKRDDSKG